MLAIILLTTKKCVWIARVRSLAFYEENYDENYWVSVASNIVGTCKNELKIRKTHFFTRYQ